MAQSFFVIIPKSPWLASLGWIKNDGEPIDERVEEILDPTWPLFPIPEIIIFPLTLNKIFIASLKGLSSPFFNKFS